MSTGKKQAGDTIVREQWGSKLAFVFAAAGSAVGLGNIWKFPYVTGQYGGGAFVLVYLVMVLMIGVPVMIAEFSLGRASGKNPIGAYGFVNPKWKFAGFLNVVAPFLILSYYSVVAGWTIAYMVRSLSGSLAKIAPEQMGDVFVGFIGSAGEPVLWHGVMMLLTIGIVISGVKGGIERSVKILMPALFVILLILVARSITLDGAAEGLGFYLRPDFSKLSGEAVLVALGQAFFSLSLGMGAMITYGSYLAKKENIPSAAVSVSLIDTLVALLAGAAIFPAVFAFGFEPGQGPGLVFVTLPAVFAAMPLGNIFGALFFLLLAIAALTSTISLLEVVVAYFVDEKKADRKKAALVIGILVFLLGVPASLSQGLLSEMTIFGKNFFDFLDYITSNIMLPIGGFLITIFAGWVWGIDNALKQITNEGTLPFALAGIWSFIIRYIAPIAIVIVFLRSLGII